MTCLECKKELGYIDHKKSMDSMGVELCAQHRKRMEMLVERNNTPKEAIRLYYGLKNVGVNPMLEWWDGSKFVTLAISRVKLNIEIDTDLQLISHERAISNLEDAMHSFKSGFTTIRIPHVLIKHYLNETIDNVLGIMDGLRANAKVI